MGIRVWPLAIALLIAACGGGGGGGDKGAAPSQNPSGNLTVVAPSNLSYPAPQPFVVSQPITSMSPTVTGTVTGYSVSPALPAGLSIDATTGAISGTPTTPTAAAIYTVTATNSAGSTTAAVSVTVIDGAPEISYANTSYNLTTGVPTPAITPINTGGAATAWTIDPALPAGLTFGADGSISGTATETGPATAYTISAQNPAGNDSFELTLTVDSGVLIDLGHSSRLQTIRRQGNRILSVDNQGHWVLWDATTTANLAQGDASCVNVDGPCDVDLAGSTLAVRVGTEVQIRDAVDGHVLSTVSVAGAWWKLASDGSYVAVGNGTSVTARTPTGTMLFSRPGNYASGKAFAAPAELRIAAGAAGGNQLETLAVPSGTSSTATYTGTFHSWFGDGSHFFTNVSNTVWIYDADGAQQDLQALTSIEELAGTGNWFWIVPDNLYVYEIGPGATPDATFGVSTLDSVIPSGNTIGILQYAVQDLSIIDLSGATPTKVDRSSPLLANTAYGASSGGEWLLGTSEGVVAATSGAPANTRYFGYGSALSVATSSERIAVATARGALLYFDADSRTLEGTIDFAASKVRLSEDGTVLAALATDIHAQYLTDRTLRVFSLPSETVIRDEPYTFNVDPWPRDFWLSGSGTVLGRVMYTSGNNRVVYPVNGGPVIWTDQFTPPPPQSVPPIHLSPNGRSIAVSNGGQRPATATNIMLDGNLVGALPGMSVGWIDDNRVLVNIYATTGGGYHFYSHSVIANGSGQQIRTVPLANMTTMQAIDADRIYSPEFNAIYSLTDGQKLWESVNPMHPTPVRRQGGVTATHVIFASGATIRSEPY